MAKGGDTTELVARKKNKSGSAGSEPKPRSGYPIFARVDERLGVILEKYLAAQRPKPTITAVLETALEDFLRSHGYELPSSSQEEGN